MKILTNRLELVAEDLDLARAGLEGADVLARQLRATVPADWPPDVMAGALGYWIPYLEKKPALVGWAAWYIIRKEDRTVIGGGGFKGLPAERRVDIGYAILPAFQRRGCATEAVEALVAWAFADERVDRVVGETFPHLTASIRVMERLEFVLGGEVGTGHGGEEHVVQYTLKRAARE